MNLALYLNFIVLLFVWRAAVLLYRNEPVAVFGINMSAPGFDSGSESAPYQLTLADNAGSPDPTQVDYNNGSNQFYEEGTHEATLTTGSGSITLDSGVNVLQYTVIGRMVHIQGQLLVDSVSSPSGNVNLSLPFPQADLSEASERTSTGIYIINLTTAINQGVIVGFGGSSTASIRSTDGTSSTDISGFVQSGTQFYINFTYLK